MSSFNEIQVEIEDDNIDPPPPISSCHTTGESNDPPQPPDPTLESELIKSEILLNLPSRQGIHKWNRGQTFHGRSKKRKSLKRTPTERLARPRGDSDVVDETAIETSLTGVIPRTIEQLDTSIRTLDRRKKLSRRQTLDVPHHLSLHELPITDLAQEAGLEDVTAEEFCSGDVRSLPLSLKHKRSFRDFLHQRQQVSYESGTLEKKWMQTKHYWDGVKPGYEVWRDSFKQIEGRHGPAALAYFRFVKWLFFMNLFITIVILGFFVMPHEFLSPRSFTASIQDSQNLTLGEEQALSCSQVYRQNLTKEVNQGGDGMKVVDFFLGEGWMEDSVLFLGHYFNKIFYYTEEGKHRTVYNLAVAYLLVTLGYFIILLVVMVYYTGDGLRGKLIVSSDRHNKYTVKIFTAWDYGLTTTTAAKHRHRNIRLELMNDLAEERQKKRRQAMSRAHRACLLLTRLVVWVVVVALWIVSFYVIILVVGTWTPQLLARPNVEKNDFLTFIVQLLPSLTLTVLNMLLPPIFYKVATFEDYSHENEIKVTLARSVIFRLTSIGVLVFSLHSRVDRCHVDKVCGNCQQITNCWESYVGKEFYRLVLVDLFIFLAFAFLVVLPRRFIVDRFASRSKFIAFMGRTDFQIPQLILDLVYSQTLAWIGAFFSPLISLITVIKFFIFFYVNKWTLLRNCCFALKPYRPSKSNYFFMIILLMAYILAVIAIAYAVGRIHPSQGCGPWRVHSPDRQYFMYMAVSDSLSGAPTGVKTILRIASSWILYLLLLIILCLIIYYNRAMTAGSKRRIKLLKYQLTLEARDKHFLMNLVNDIIAGT